MSEGVAKRRRWLVMVSNTHIFSTMAIPTTQVERTKQAPKRTIKALNVLLIMQHT